MAARRERKGFEVVQLEMTPMIDVVFQLLIFFIVTLSQADILAHLDVVRPAPRETLDRVRIEPLTILIANDGFVLQGCKVPLREVEKQLVRTAGRNPDAPVVIKCQGDSPHAYLVQLLNICTKTEMTNLSLFSM